VYKVKRKAIKYKVSVAKKKKQKKAAFVFLYCHLLLPDVSGNSTPKVNFSVAKKINQVCLA